MEADPLPVFRIYFGCLFLKQVLNGRTMAIFIWTAFGLFSTLASMVTPCSVKTDGRYLGCLPCPDLKVTICDFRNRPTKG